MTSLKNIRIAFLFIFLFGFMGFSQRKLVRLIEDKQKKRTILYIQNDTNEDKSVFLKIKPTGYRRSAQRPIIKNIPAKTKVQILILVPLADVISHYTYDLIVNEKLDIIEVERIKNSQKKDSTLF